MKGLIQEYGQIMLVVAIVLLLLLFGKTGFASNIKTLFVNQVASTIAENPNNDKQVVVVRYEKPDGTFTNYETIESVKKNDGETFSWSSPETDAFQAKSLSYTVNGGKVNKVDVMRKKYTLDVNGYYNSSPYDNVENYGTFDLNHANDQGSFKYKNLTFNKDTKEYTINTPGKWLNSPGWWGDKCHTVSLNGLEIPYSKWYVIEFEINPSKNGKYILDVNNKVVGAADWNGNDNDNIDKRSNPTDLLKANEWKKVRIYYQNSNPKNNEKLSLIDKSVIYIRYDNDSEHEFFKIRNFKTYVSNNPNKF